MNERVNERVNIQKIAQESGVSITTVSRVLNGTGPVSAKTRERVELAIQKYNYSPNALARSLISRQSMMLGVIVPDISNPYFSAMFNQVERAALNAGYSVILCNTFFSSQSLKEKQKKTEEEYFQMMIAKQVDGVLIIGGQVDLCTVSEEYKEGLRRLSQIIPVVVIGKPLPDTGCLFIERETGSGVVTALNYLYSLGHHHIAFAGGEPGVVITEKRLDAYRTALGAFGLNYDSSLVALTNYYTPDGYTAAEKLLAAQKRFTAVIAINDNVAIGLHRALTDRGISVPEDVALISCDQFFMANYLTPRLTSIDQHSELFGRMVIQVLLCAIKGIGEPIKMNFTPELIIRESCGTKLGYRNLE